MRRTIDHPFFHQLGTHGAEARHLYAQGVSDGPGPVSTRTQFSNCTEKVSFERQIRTPRRLPRRTSSTRDPEAM